MSEHSVSKRKFLKTTAYVAPAILTLAVAQSFAATGSGGKLKGKDEDKKKKE